MQATRSRDPCLLCERLSHLFTCPGPQPGVTDSMFLGRREEDVLFRHYERRVLDFCNAFKPVMPKSVVVCTLPLPLPLPPVCVGKHACMYLSHVRLTCAGYSRHVLQEILPEQLHHGIPPQDHHVSSSVLLRHVLDLFNGNISF